MCIRDSQGTVTILLEGGGYRGRCFYSPKIPHCLGEGDVHLSLALLDPGGYEEGLVQGEDTQFVFGDVDAFSESSYIPGIPAVKLGAVLYLSLIHICIVSSYPGRPGNTWYH